MKNFFLCLICIACFSCNQTDNKNSRNTPKLIHQTILNSNEIILGLPKLFALTEHHISIYDKKTDSLFHIINNQRNVKSFGRKGQGPDEFIYPQSLFHYPHSEILCLMDAGKRTVYQLNPNTNQIEHVFSNKDVVHFNVLPMKDKQYISNGLYDDARFYLLDSIGLIIDKYKYYPIDNSIENIDKRVLSQAYMCEMASNTDGDKFAASVIYSNILSLYKVENGEIKLINEIVDSQPTFRYNKEHYEGIDSKSPFGYISVTASNNYVYVLHSGKNYKEYGDLVAQCTDLLVYNWKGELLNKFILDMAVHQIRISKDDKYLYAVNFNPDSSIVKFPVPVINKK